MSKVAYQRSTHFIPLTLQFIAQSDADECRDGIFRRPHQRDNIVQIPKFIIASTLLWAANSFAEPVPAAKADYVGTWQGKDMHLAIAADGKITYNRLYSSKKQVKLNIELARFNGDDFDAGFGIFNSTFVVSKPPAKVGEKIEMVVDGVVLTKID